MHMQVANHVVISIMHVAVPRLLITPHTGGSINLHKASQLSSLLMRSYTGETIHLPQASQLFSGYDVLSAPLRLALSAMAAQVPDSGVGAVRLLVAAGVYPTALTVPPDRYISANCIAALLQSVRL